jgi:hypothetical protein
MCGIWGVAYGPGGPESEMWTPAELAQLMFPAIAHRGKHAWGWMACNAAASAVDYFKMEGRCDTREALETMPDIPGDARWVVGHVRAATHGSPAILANNHPIEHGEVIGVHNGVLRNHRVILEETGRQDPVATVDSEAIFASINKWGMRGGLARVQGDMVSVFAHLGNPAVLRIARSFNRPLVYATTAAGSLIFASEECVLEATGLDYGPVTNFKGKYRMLTVRQGRITERVQYRADSWKNFEGGVSGITDFYENRRAGDSIPLPPRARVNGQPVPAPTLVVPPKHRSGRGHAPVTGKKDRHGGQHLGGGLYRTPDGRTMTVEEYVDWSVQQTMNNLAASRAADDEAQAQSVIDNNNRGGRA